MFLTTNLTKNPCQETELSPMTSIIEKIPFLFLSNIYIYIHLQPRDIVNFLCSCTTIRNIDNQYRMKHPIAYDELMAQARFNFLKERSIEQLSTDMIYFCTNDKIKDLQSIMKFLFLYNKFNELTIGKLSLFFELVAGSGYVDDVESIISSTRFKEIPIEQIGIALELASDKCYVEIVQSLLKSARFQDIPKEQLNITLAFARKTGLLNLIE